MTRQIHNIHYNLDNLSKKITFSEYVTSDLKFYHHGNVNSNDIKDLFITG